MTGRVVEIAEDGRHLKAYRGFLVVEEKGAELGRVPLDDIAVVIANAHGITYSNNLMVKLAEHGAAVVLCGANHSPVAWLWPLDGHHVQTSRMASQLDAPKPLKKRLWQSLVKAKILNQGAVLEAQGKPSGAFENLAAKVRSGDPDNLEGQAAKRYWPLLMGPKFRRDRRLSGANALFNYGYTILRSGVARAVVAAGLHPSIGLHHRGQYNAMVLVDDLMEPFRPYVDLAVQGLVKNGIADVTKDVKIELAAILTVDLHTAQGTTPLSTCLMRLATSLAHSFEEQAPKLELPLSPLPLDFSRHGQAG